MYALYHSIISVILHILFIPRRCRYGPRNMVGRHLGNSLVYTCALVTKHQTEQLKGTWKCLASLLYVCIDTHTHTDILYILSVLYYQDLGRGNTNNHGRALAQLGSGIRNRTEALRKSIQGACKVPQTTVPSPLPTLSRGRSGESLK